MKQTFLLFTLVLIFAEASFSQDNIGMNFIFMTWHPKGDAMAFLQPNKLDKDAKLVLNWGGVAHYERFIYRNRISIKLAQGAYSDCAKLFAGHTHLAFRLNVLNADKHALRLGFGPTLVYRKSWYQLPGYVQQNRYLKTKGDWQYAFVWYGGEIEYDYKISKNCNLSFHVIPGFPDFCTIGVGVRYWLHPIPSARLWRNLPNRNKWFYKHEDINP